jgi:chorismate-pyruvate lyase
VHRYVVKFTAATPLRKARLTARRAWITHAASPMLDTLVFPLAMIVVSFRPGEV